MLMPIENELDECLSQFEGAWRAFSADFPEFEWKELPGIKICWPDVPLMFFNMGFLNDPVRDAADLQERARTVLGFMRTKKFPGLLGICEDHLAPDLRPEAASILAAENLYPAMSITGMAASELLPPKRLPTDLTLRRATSEADAITILDLNCQAYGVPLEIGRASVSKTLTDPSSHCYIGERNGQAITCSVTFPLNGRLYVAFVATLPDHRCRGCAEAVMRASLASCAAATGLTRTVLHATDAGQPVYKRMGYHDTAKFMLYAQPMPDHA